MKLAKWIFRIAGIYGVLVIAPLYFMEDLIGKDHPAGITHPEFFYGFVCVTLAAQFMFLVISTDPIKFRPLMVVSMWEKFSYVIACVILLMHHRVNSSVIFFVFLDAVLGTLFIVAWLKTAPSKS